ncbi:MAG: tryptophan--tRNA ligase [Caldisericia bacterium]|nr:tryptophan--tRNA ligase [Caldisericia bacterium]
MKRVVSGMRPTGKLHLGNYLGALKNWVSIQEKYDCYFFIADYHSLTTKYERTREIRSNLEEVVMDWLSAGLDPEKSVLYVQSGLPEIPTLHLLFSMIVPMPWLERNPTVKEMVRDLNLKENVGYGLLGYPVLQAADILIVKGEFVPVGKDQLPHLELTREIARRFNYLYGDLFPEPQPLLTETPIIKGIDGRKMSKSLGNQINLSDEKEEIESKIIRMVTDPEKIRKGDPGHPDVCSVFSYYKTLFPETAHTIKKECESGKRGCVQCKKELADRIYKKLEPLRERRVKFENNKKLLWDIINFGTEKARKIAKETVKKAKELIGIDYI